MKYKLIERANPQDRKKSKWYAAPVNEGCVSQREIEVKILELSSLSRGEISHVIEKFISMVPRYLFQGKSVNFGDLGTLRLSFTSEGVDEKDKFSESMISTSKVIFTPSVELKKAFEELCFEKTE